MTDVHTRNKAAIAPLRGAMVDFDANRSVVAPAEVLLAKIEDGSAQPRRVEIDRPQVLCGSAPVPQGWTP